MFELAIDQQKLEAFIGRLMGDMSGAVTGIMCALGDRLGLFKALAGSGPVTSADLAAATGLHERYVREWLSTLVCAGYLQYDPASERFTLPPEYALVLAAEGSPLFMGGAFQQLPALFGPLDQVAEDFRRGQGVPQAAYGPDLPASMERVSAGWFDHLLVQQWLPLLPEVEARLRQGALVADIGCGSGRALINLARAFPASRFVGYDLFAPVVARAASNAEAAGVAAQVRFEQRDLLAGLPETYDLITTFDSAHDFVDPAAALRAIRAALRPDGVYLMLEMNCSDKLEENVGPVGTLLYSTSVLYNLPVALAAGGAALGTMGLPEATVRHLCAAAGFSSVERFPVANPFNVLYAIRP